MSRIALLVAACTLLLGCTSSHFELKQDRPHTLVLVFPPKGSSGTEGVALPLSVVVLVQALESAQAVEADSAGEIRAEVPVEVKP